MWTQRMDDRGNAVNGTAAAASTATGASAADAAARRELRAHRSIDDVFM